MDGGTWWAAVHGFPKDFFFFMWAILKVFVEFDTLLLLIF